MLTDENWDPQFYQIIQLIIRDQRTDALLRLQLLERVIEVACEGSHLLAESFKSYRVAMSSAGVNLFSNWLDPNDNEARRNREKAQQLLTDLAGDSQPAKRIAELRQSLQTPFATEHRWVAVLIRGEQGKWTARAPEAPPQAGKLFLIVQSVKDGPIAIREMGVIEKGQFVVSGLASELAVEGRPVFIAESPEP
jgi:hypothetical protein